MKSWLTKRSILVTCGTGGVGKTTLSAALGLLAAIHGKKCIVITIDPAKRLATSLGLGDHQGEPQNLTAAVESSIGKKIAGEFHALIPDTTKSFDRLLESLNPDPHFIARMKSNAVYQMIASDFSGSNEYMALFMLEEVMRTRKYDLIVLDTPPSRNTVHFLNAPKLLSRFFDDKFFKWIMVPSSKIVSFGMKKILGLLESLIGEHFMVNLVDFAAGLFEVQDRFVHKIKSMSDVLASPGTGFVVVGTQTTESVQDLKDFIALLREKQFQFDGVLLNRSLSYLAETPSPTTNEAGKRWIQHLRSREQHLERELAPLARIIAKVPELSRDVHSIGDLYHVATKLDSTL